MMGCSWVDMTKKYERYICDSKVDDDSMVASDLKQFAYTAEEDEPGTAARRAFCHRKKTGMAGSIHSIPFHPQSTCHAPIHSLVNS